MKIAVASVMQETCSFNGMKTTLADFKAHYFREGSAVVDVPENEWTTGAFVAAMRRRGHQIVGVVAAHDTAGGIVTSDAYAALKQMVVAGMKRVLPVDAVFMTVHGAMAAEDEPDPEGMILRAVRELVGRDVFIAVAFDHHANVTRRMVEAADVMVAFETQPHDLPATGAKTARVVLDIWDRRRTPHAAFIKVPMYTPQDQFLTAAGPMKEWFDLARSIERDPAVIAASTCPTQPWLDVQESGWASLVYADDAATAQRYARTLAQKAWALRERFWVSGRTSVEDTVAAANEEPRGLVVISDTGDSTYGGATGDSMVLIAEMLRQGLNGDALVPVVDPEAVRAAFAAGPGQEMRRSIGGRRCAEFSPAMELSGIVTAVAPGGRFEFAGLNSESGRSALLDCGRLKVALLERRDRMINHPSLYQRLGLDPAKAKMVVLKTASNFQYFEPYRSRLIRADTPGSTQSNLGAFRWRHIDRPTYPFDPLPTWSPPE